MKAFYLSFGVVAGIVAYATLFFGGDNVDFWGFIILSNMYLIASTNAR